jgi:hypothetical protein
VHFLLYEQIRLCAPVPLAGVSSPECTIPPGSRESSILSPFADDVVVFYHILFLQPHTHLAQPDGASLLGGPLHDGEIARLHGVVAPNLYDDNNNNHVCS